MDRKELLRLLKDNKTIGFVHHEAEVAPGVKVRQIITLTLCVPDVPGHYTGRELSEEPSYARRQKIIQTKPFLVNWCVVSPTPQLWEWVEIYFADLEEVGVFLEQFGKSLSDFHVISDSDFDVLSDEEMSP